MILARHRLLRLGAPLFCLYCACISDAPAEVGGTAPPDGARSPDLGTLPEAGSSSGGELDGGGKDGGPVATDAEGGTTTGDRIVFLTMQKLVGNGPGGATRFDDACMAEAAPAPKTAGKKFKAWVSTTTLPAKERVSLAGFTGRFVLADGTTVVAKGTPDLLDSSLAIAIDRTATMTVSPNGQAWTGTLTTGTVASIHCGDWLNGGQGSAGSAKLSTAEWTASAVVQCVVPLGVYCFEVP